MRKAFIIVVLIGGFLIVGIPRVWGAVCCAPGDIPMNPDGTVATETDKATRCLYGSEIICNSGLGGNIGDVRDNIRVGLNIALGFLGIVVVIMVIYGGSLWLTAAGNDDKVKKGKHTLMWAAIGAVVISLAWTIASYFLQLGRQIGS